MAGALSLLGLLGWLAPLLAAAPTVAPPAGPRVTLAAAAQPLGSVLLSLAQQLNRRFGGTVASSNVWLSRPISVAVTAASAREALQAVEAAAGVEFTRQGWGTWVVEPASRPARPSSWQTAAGFAIQLGLVRYYETLTLLPADPAKVQVYQMLSPYFSIMAPSDPAGLQLAATGPLVAVTDRGERLLPQSPADSPRTDESRQAASWSFYAHLAAPQQPARLLTTVELPLRLWSGLQEHRARLKLPVGGSVTAEVAGYTLTATPRGNAEGPPQWTVRLQGPAPAGLDARQAAAWAQQRAPWIEAQLRAADEQPLLTEVRAQGGSGPPAALDVPFLVAASNDRWVSGLTAGPTPATQPPATLDLTFWLPQPPWQTVTATWRDIALPPLAREEAP
ncbi:MAG: hypothetical protein IT204_00315 [Fimbriimonadaceae bacterium]|nr:hypothetical protein [Fimbriimonadaceae bacterium]